MMKNFLNRFRQPQAIPALYALAAGGTAAGVSTVVSSPAAGVLTLAAVVTGWLVGSLIPSKTPDATQEEAVPEVETAPSLTDELKAQLVLLRKNAQKHTAADTPLTQTINQILSDTQEFFRRVYSKQNSQSHRLAAVNYTDTLTKLNKALSAEYYLDIRKNPRLWTSAEKRLAAVEKATNAVEKQLLRNIQQANASQDIDYEIILDDLSEDVDANQPLRSH